jgi:8-oxo-dGTP pyrophosphatase MutT (NUDIX family)
VTVVPWPDPRPGRLRLLGELRGHEPADDRERRSLRRTLGLVDTLRDPFDPAAQPTHVTASAIVLDERGRVLLHLHKRLGRWLQPGGHLEPVETPHEAAVRETVEETGLDQAHLMPVPGLLHVDVHPGPLGHTHLDLRYLLRVGREGPLRPADGESPDVRWWPLEDALGIADDSLAAAIQAARRR